TSDADVVTVRRDRCAFGKRNLTVQADPLNHSGLNLRAQSFNPEQDHGWTPVASNREVCMEVVIKRHANPIPRSRCVENLHILGFANADLANVDGFDAALTKQYRCTRGQPLVQQNRDHATRSMLRLSSSTAAAA